MELVDKWDDQYGQHEEQDPVAEDEVAGEHSQFDNLAQELAARLRQRMPAHVVPFARPPRDVGRVRLELARQRQRHDELDDEALDGDDGDHAE